MRRSLLLWVATLVGPCLLLGATPARPPAVPQRALALGEDRLAAEVEQAIREGVAFLKRRQADDGGWEVGAHSGSNPGGWTALALLALLTAGERPSDPAVASGLRYLRTLPRRHTYVVALQTMALAQARQPEDRARLGENVVWLLESREPDGWTYSKASRGGTPPDNSNTQYALLALHEARAAGVAVPAAALEAVRAFYVRTQRDGGWAYNSRTAGNSMTMTTAGLSGLVITGMDLGVGRARLRPDGSAENCGVYADNEPVRRALDWIGGHFPGRLTEASALEQFRSPFYCLYGVERVGRLTGERYLGGHDWYEIGARYLVDARKADGHWEGSGGGQLDGWDVVATSFSLLFLARGKTPVLVSKLAYGPPEETGWNNKRNDVRHLVEFASRELFKGQPLAWQVFDARGRQADTREERRALAAELLPSPVVYFNGHDFAPRDKVEDVLREYVTNGGFVLAEDCCGRPGFDRDFRALVGRLLPDSRLEPLEPEHPIWLASRKFAVSPRDFPLEGVKMGCKTVIVYSPTPLAGYWEADDQAGERGRKAFQLGANVLAYATGLEAPRQKLPSVRIDADDPDGKERKRGYLQAAQLMHGGDWRPAPRAMRSLMSEARKEGLDVVLEAKGVAPSARTLTDYRFFYLHGRAEFSERKEDLQKLRFVLKAGGTLLADACCGSSAFDASFRELIRRTFADDRLALEPIPPNDALFGADLNGAAIERVQCRRRGADGRVDPAYRSLPPELEGVKYRGRWVVIYSKYDLGCALERHTSPDCLGHDYESALRLARAALFSALRR